MNNISALTPKQLRQAAKITERIQKLQKELNSILGESATETTTAKPAKRKMSAAGKAAIRAAVKARWAKVAAEKAGKSSTAESKSKRKISAAAKAKMSAAAKERWAKRKAEGQTKL